MTFAVGGILYSIQTGYTIPVYGKDVKTVIEQPLQESHLHQGKNTVTYEARLLKALLLRLQTY
jgi:tetratricopeptide repeat protein 30